LMGHRDVELLAAHPIEHQKCLSWMISWRLVGSHPLSFYSSPPLLETLSPPVTNRHSVFLSRPCLIRFLIISMDLSLSRSETWTSPTRLPLAFIVIHFPLRPQDGIFTPLGPHSFLMPTHTIWHLLVNNRLSFVSRCQEGTSRHSRPL